VRARRGRRGRDWHRRSRSACDLHIVQPRGDALRCASHPAHQRPQPPARLGYRNRRPPPARGRLCRWQRATL